MKTGSKLNHSLTTGEGEERKKKRKGKKMRGRVK